MKIGLNINRINDTTWEIPSRGKMNVPVIIFSSPSLLEILQRDKTLVQAENVACLPGIERGSYVMPDGHQGYGFPIGGVAAFDREEGIISPGGVGYDINCGVRLLRTDWTSQDILPFVDSLLSGLFQNIPAGVGKGGTTRIKAREIKEVCVRGAEWAVNNGYGRDDDLAKTEEGGRMPGADAAFLSQRSIERGVPQLGTLGAGNHFLEIQKVVRIYDKVTADAFGIQEEGQVVVLIHCGSRGLGHQVASDFIRQMENTQQNISFPDRELVCAPLTSELGRRYFKSMAAAVNFAFANRQMITHRVRSVFENILGTANGMNQVYDVCHNVAKFENHKIGGEMKSLCVHRKGATRSFGPGREEVPESYRNVGQPVLIPGSMGTASYILAGTKEAENLSFGSTAHGAGRMMSRHEAVRRFRGEDVKKEMADRGITLRFTGWKGVAEEAAGAYKDVEEVVDVSHRSGLGRLVARVEPIGVMKG